MPSYGSGQVTLGSTQTLITVIGSGRSVTVKNMGNSDIYLGGPDVSTAAGYPLSNKDSVTLLGHLPKPAVMVPAPAGDGSPVEIWGVTASPPDTVAWIGS